jgi:hypothetical protein
MRQPRRHFTGTRRSPPFHSRKIKSGMPRGIPLPSSLNPRTSYFFSCFISHAMFWPSCFIVRMPSSSFLTSPGSLPWARFQ